MQKLPKTGFNIVNKDYLDYNTPVLFEKKKKITMKKFRYIRFEKLTEKHFTPAAQE